MQSFKDCLNEKTLRMVKGLIFCVFSLSALQEMYKASKYEVAPDMKHVLLAYNMAPVSSFICLLVF